MSNPAHDFHEEEDDQGEIFLDEDDIIRESTVDDEGPHPLRIYLYLFFCVKSNIWNFC